MSEERKIFEDYPEVDCNGCELYWTDRCDSAGRTPKDCKFYKATRAVVIPAQLDDLEHRLNRSNRYHAICVGLLLIIDWLMYFAVR